MDLIKNNVKLCDCATINKQVMITYVDREYVQPSGNTAEHMVDCYSAHLCGVQNAIGAYDWNNCQIFQNTLAKKTNW